MADLGMISFAFATSWSPRCTRSGTSPATTSTPPSRSASRSPASSPGPGCPPTSAPSWSARPSARPPSSACSARRPATVGLGVAAYGDGVGAGQAFIAEFVGTFILVFTVFGVIHRKAAAGFAGLAIGLVVFAAIIPVAPATGASINPARTFGPMLVQQIAGGTVHWSQLPVYLLAELPAGAAAAARLHRDRRAPRPTATGRHAELDHRPTRIAADPAHV